MKTKYFLLLFCLSISGLTNGQVIKFAMEEWNFGSINSGDSVVIDFGFINSGDQPLVISEIQSSCKCASASWNSNPFKPNEKGFIKLSYSSIGKMGMQDKTATIISNNKDGNKILHLKGNVSTGKDFTPSTTYTNNTIKETIPPPSELDSLKSFWGIPFGSSKDFVIKNMKAKGIILTEKADGKRLRLSASNISFANKNVFLLNLKFINDKFYDAILLYETASPHIKDDFRAMVDNLNRKYFKAEEYETYKSPYEKGDGHEESAISMGYGELSAFWMFAKGNAISLETYIVGKNNYIKLDYQDSDLVDEAQVEQTKTSDY